jgi:hypothetical protein
MMDEKVRVRGPLIAGIVGLFVGGSLAGGESVLRSPIVDRAIEYHGGSRFDAGRTTFDVCSKAGCATVVVEMNRGRFVYDVTAAAGAGKRRVRSTNDSVELWEQDRSVPIEGTRRSQQLRDWAMERVYFNFLPYRLNDPSVYKEDLGEESWGGRALHKIKVTFEPGSSTSASDEFLYWFDPDTARLELFAYSYDVNGGGLRFRRLFNYRRVGGILFFDQQNWGVEGADLSVDLVTEEFVDASMRRVSTVEVRNIGVEALP